MLLPLCAQIITDYSLLQDNMIKHATFSRPVAKRANQSQLSSNRSKITNTVNGPNQIQMANRPSLLAGAAFFAKSRDALSSIPLSQAATSLFTRSKFNKNFFASATESFAFSSMSPLQAQAMGFVSVLSTLVFFAQLVVQCVCCCWINGADPHDAARRSGCVTTSSSRL